MQKSFSSCLKWVENAPCTLFLFAFFHVKSSEYKSPYLPLVKYRYMLVVFYIPPAFFLVLFLYLVTFRMDWDARLLFFIAILASMFLLFKAHVFVKAAMATALQILLEGNRGRAECINGILDADSDALNFEVLVSEGQLPVTIFPKHSEVLVMSRDNLKIMVPSYASIYRELRSRMCA